MSSMLFASCFKCAVSSACSTTDPFPTSI
jgi:hypothetical protein